MEISIWDHSRYVKDRSNPYPEMATMLLLSPSEFRRRFEAMSEAGVQGACIFNKTNIYSDDYLSVIKEYDTTIHSCVPV